MDKQLSDTNTSLSAGAFPLPMSAYAEAIQSGGSPSAGNAADHTYVIATHPNVIYNCPCYGTPRMPGPALAPVIHVPQGDMNRASAMINKSVTLKTVYNGRSDHCGIHYALSGVCHTMTNRILFSASPVPTAMDPTIHIVRGLVASTTFYGVFGRTIVSFARRLFNTTATAVGSSANKAMPDYDTFCEDLIQKVRRSTDVSESLKNLILMELEGTSSPEKRFRIIYDAAQKRSIAGFRSASTSLDRLLVALDQWVKAIDVLKEPEETSSIAELNLYGAEVNKAFQLFDATAFTILGSVDYQRLFRFKYDKDFVLCENLVEE